MVGIRACNTPLIIAWLLEPATLVKASIRDALFEIAPRG